MWISGKEYRKLLDKLNEAVKSKDTMLELLAYIIEKKFGGKLDLPLMTKGGNFTIKITSIKEENKTIVSVIGYQEIKDATIETE